MYASLGILRKLFLKYKIEYQVRDLAKYNPLQVKSRT